MFFVNGAAIGVWVAQIPFVQHRFDLSKSTLGLILLTMSIGVIVALPVMGQAIVRLGSARAVRLAGTVCCLLVPLPLLAPEPYLLPLALIAFGAAAGSMDVSMNAHGSAIEGRLGRPIMSSLHAGWSFGGFAGAAGVAAATAAGADPRVQNTVAAGLLLAGLLACLTALGPGSATAAGERFRLPSRAVVLMAVLCFLTMVTEGAMADWGGVYLRGDLGASAGLAAATFAAFAAGMTVGRLTGDRINQQIGPTRNPSEPIELTAAIDGPDVSTPPAPAALKSSGTPFATPTPTSARPASATIGSASTSIVPSAIAASAEPPRSRRVGPMR